MLSLFGGFFLIYGISKTSVSEGAMQLLIVGAVFLTCIVFSILLFAEGENEASIANFESAHFGRYFGNIVSCLKDGFLFGLLLGVLILIAYVSLPYYFSIWLPLDGSKGSLWGLLMLSLTFWFLVITLLSLQWFLPVRNLMHNKFFKCLKKSYILFFDNTGFSILLAINNLVLIAISVISLGIVPGFNSVVLGNTNALRLRLYKYDWLEVNPGLTKKQAKDVPWDELLLKDKHTLGPRKFKSFIFPWKQD